MTFEYRRTDDRLTLRRPGTRWLSNGFDGGYRTADAAHNLTVPEGFDRTDLDAYAAERLGESPAGPTLLTGVSQRHARGARRGPVTAVATAGLSNPAALPMDPSADAPPADPETDWRPGTVNVFVGTTAALDSGGLAGLLATAVEAKAATLLDAAGVPGTTSDAVAVGCDPTGEPSAFAGSATAVGGAARACVREAISASLQARYDGESPPTPTEARYGVSTDAAAEVFEP
ncbi:adenosylcobinamide amidohydrolase [Natronomonas marina]|jgi:adenosylcobinamide hydrolase|uniref:adenosylcobinamide amidohydrolase n=1 Tax=Natronomonas marina TaxID=2961939 RepID=UPI0020C94CA3|nr:adenosylcobinamide amidohydrolase [Natronomonas marina]